MEQLIKTIVAEFLKSNDTVEDVTPLYGDASYRTYYRVFLKSGTSYIVMKMPEGAASASEEITNYKGAGEELPYINISNYLRKNGLPVPKIHQYDRANEAIILEDMGDDLLYSHVCGADDGAKRAWYKNAIELLVKVKDAPEEADCIAFKRSFDATLLNWEFDHFLEYYLEVMRSAKLGRGEREKFSEYTRGITGEITKAKYVFTHRDYQSRNLMVRHGGLSILDFQDALMGPEAYDMVALLRDSYVEVSDALLNELIGHYCGLRRLDGAAFRREFDTVTIQRKMKDAGRFVYIDRVKKNPNYLQHIPRSLKYVKRALRSSEKYAPLFELLLPHVPEWKNES